MLTRDHPPHVRGGMGICSGYIERLFPCYGIDLTIIAGDPTIYKVRKEVKEKVVVYRVPLLGQTFLTRMPSFAYFADRIIPQIEKEFDCIYSLSSPFMCKITRPLVAHFQGSRYGEYKACALMGRLVYAFLNKAYIPYEKRLLQAACGVIALSQDMVGELQAFGVPQDKIEIIPNGVDTGLFKPISMRHFDAAVKKILFVGRLDARKGIDILLRAVKNLANGPGVVVQIAGAGREEKRLRAQAAKLSLAVEFLGKLPYEFLPEVYRNADLFVLPSLYEGLPLAALEAMSSATPTLVSTGCPDLGLPRFKKNSVGDLTTVLQVVLSSDGHLKTLSEHGLYLSKQYDWQKVIEKIAHYLKACVS